MKESFSHASLFIVCWLVVFGLSLSLFTLTPSAGQAGEKENPEQRVLSEEQRPETPVSKPEETTAHDAKTKILKSFQPTERIGADTEIAFPVDI